ncbi:MAG: LysR family transcriptional regulator [Lachnospiraceae bacterium]|nr:LysR family transcriptional regulator [Lachnospiraceae bacterium]
MDLKKLEYLKTIYRVRNFSKAAEEHYISQPSISNAIQKLEAELGTTLIDRNSKPLVFTPAGEHFMHHVNTILDAVAYAERDMKEFLLPARKTIHTAFHPTRGAWLLTPIYSDFQQKYPQIDIVVHDVFHNQMLSMLESGDLDLTYTLIPEDLDLNKFRTIPLQNCELYAMLPKGHPLENYRKVSISMLKNETLITFPPGSLIYARLKEEFRANHIDKAFYTLQPIRIMREMVEEGRGIAFVTRDEFSQLSDTDLFSVRPLENLIRFLKGFLLKKEKELTPSMSLLISYIEDQIHQKRLEREA